MELDLSSKKDFPEMGESITTVKQKETQTKPSFSDAVGGEVEEMEVSMERLFKFRSLVQKSGEETRLVPPPETIQAIKEKMVTYRVYNIKEKRMTDVKNEMVEKCMAPIWSKVSHVNRGARSATVEAHFETAEVARQISTQTLKNESIILLPLYLGCRTAKVTLEDIPTGYDVMWAATAVIFDVESKLTILSMKRKIAKHWRGQQLEMIIQAENATLESLPDRVFVGEGHSIRVSVEGRRPRCFKCGQKGHVRSVCTKKNNAGNAPPQNAVKNAESSKVEKKVTAGENKEEKINRSNSKKEEDKNEMQNEKGKDEENNATKTNKQEDMEFTNVSNKRKKSITPDSPPVSKKKNNADEQIKNILQSHPGGTTLIGQHFNKPHPPTVKGFKPNEKIIAYTTKNVRVETWVKASTLIRCYKATEKEAEWRYGRVGEEGWKDKTLQSHVKAGFIKDVTQEVTTGKLPVSPAATPTQSPVATPVKHPTATASGGETGRKNLSGSLSQPHYTGWDTTIKNFSCTKRLQYLFFSL
ncbi:uncharacterized protein LOC115216432 [Octopus sinensis]|uniref:Uncharacterized protein LOC115216432 n=1 Tax=Octopus sinensis TaxID=2607531 RepID=A0A6P7STS5_9MOLL|nr:uncharacterized protein LOC115216432 [Octopus sinensis]